MPSVHRAATRLSHRRVTRSAFRPRRMLAILAAVAMLSPALAACGDKTPQAPEGTPAPDVEGVSISAACGGAGTIEPGAAYGDADWAAVEPADAVECFDLTATAADDAGIAVDSAFVLDATEDIGADAVKALLAVEPPVAFDVAVEEASSAMKDTADDALAGIWPAAAVAHAHEDGSGAHYRITPAAPLAEGVVYRFHLLDRSEGGRPVQSWAFQTRRPLRVVQTLPADRAVDVPITTGIELVFSHAGVTGVEAGLNIDPHVEGTVEVRKRTAVFVPKSLAPDTLYTVELSGDAVGMSGSAEMRAEPFRFQFKTAVESAADADAQPPKFFRPLWETATGESPALSLFSYTGNATSPFAGKPLAVTVYRYPDIAVFVQALDRFAFVPDWARDSRTGLRVDPAKPALTEVAKFDATLEPIGEVGELLVRFPEPLPTGHYLVDARLNGETIQAWLQVTDVAAYVAVSAGKTVIWANNAATSRPIAGAEVLVTEGALRPTPAVSPTMLIGKTGADGVAFFDTPAGVVRDEPVAWPLGARMPDAVVTLVVAAGGDEAAIPLSDAFQNAQYTAGIQEFAERGDATRYWRYLYSDRQMYRPTDTVNFWGIARPREDPPASQALTVDIVAADPIAMAGIDYGPATVARTAVEAGASGTFIGKLAIAGAAPGAYQLRVRSGELVILTQWIEVMDFVKPAYKIDVTPARQAILAGETVDVAVQASFFEGSPVPGAGLHHAGDVEGDVTTDAAGAATVTLSPAPASPDSPNYGDYRWASVSLSPALAEEGDIGGNAMVRVFNAALSLEVQARAEGESGLVEGTLRGVDFDRINDGTAKNMDDYRADPVAGAAISAKVEEITWERRETGESYDPIAKQVVKQYEYTEKRTPLGTFDATTGADGAFEIAFPVQAERSYEVVATTTDDAGRLAAQVMYVDGGGGRAGVRLTELAEVTKGPYVEGDTVTVEMRREGAPVPAGEAGAFLFLQARNDIHGYTLQDGPRHTFTFAAEHAPNVNVTGVQFDGRTYREVRYPIQARLDTKSRALTVAIAADRPSFGPGETAKVTVTVADAGGKPAVAEVLLSAVDDAIFRLQGQGALDNMMLLDTLYRAVGTGILSSYASHQSPKGEMGAEGGGGGGFRDTFKDTALFTRVTTAADGTATVDLPLPDNLTSWRVAGLAITDDLHAGSGTGLVPVKRPLFADVTLNTTYLAADRPVLRLRAFGEGLKDGDSVRFEVAAPTLMDAPLTADGAAFESVDIPLPALKLGPHSLAITVTSGDLSDSLKRDIKVVMSRREQLDTTYSELDAGAVFAWDGAAGSPEANVVVNLDDLNRGRYFGPLQSLAMQSNDRLDAALARDVAIGLLHQHFGDDRPASEFHAGTYRTDGGGLGLFPYGGADLDASVRAAALAPDRVGRETLAAFLFKIADDPDETSERTAAALYGLAALGAPVLADVQSLARAVSVAQAADVTPMEQLYAGLAAAELGDRATASGLYRGLIEAHAEGRGRSARLNVGEDQEDILAATALAAVLGAMLGDDAAPALFQYGAENPSAVAVYDLERVNFIAEALPRLAPTPARYSFVEAGETKTASLADVGSVTLRMQARDIAALNLKVEEGRLGVTVRAPGASDPAEAPADPDAQLARSYVAGDWAEVKAAAVADQAPQSDYAIGEGDTVRVVLSYTLGDKAVAGCYQVTDLLPSGLVPVTQPYQRGITFVEEGAEPDYPYSVDGQRVSFCVDPSREGKPLTYYARVLGKGTYAAEPAFIQAQQAPERASVSEPATVEVK